MPTAIPDTPADILRSPALDVVPYAARHGALAARLGIDLGATVFAAGHIPLCLERARHAPARRAVAELVAAATPAVRAALPALVSGHFAPLLAPRPVPVEAMTASVQPAVAALLSRLAGFELGLGPDTLTSRLFSPGLGVARRQRMEAELRALIDRIRRAHPGAPSGEVGARLSVAILGHDALTGTIGASLAALLPEGETVDPAALPWEAAPPRTGVPYVDRVALEPATLGDRQVAPGETVRARLDALEGAPAPDRLGFFGAGAHLCLGRALSLDLWAEIGRQLRAAPVRLRRTGYALRRDDVFCIPERLEIEVLPP